MNKIVREKYPAAKLPADLRSELGDAAWVKVTIEGETPVDGPDVMTLEEIFALARGAPRRSVEEIDEDLRCQRDGWDRRG